MGEQGIFSKAWHWSISVLDGVMAYGIGYGTSRFVGIDEQNAYYVGLGALITVPLVTNSFRHLRNIENDEKIGGLEKTVSSQKRELSRERDASHNLREELRKKANEYDELDKIMDAYRIAIRSGLAKLHDGAPDAWALSHEDVIKELKIILDAFAADKENKYVLSRNMIELATGCKELVETLRRTGEEMQQLPANFEIHFYSNMLEIVRQILKPEIVEDVMRESMSRVRSHFSELSKAYVDDLDKLREDSISFERRKTAELQSKVDGLEKELSALKFESNAGELRDILTQYAVLRSAVNSMEHPMAAVDSKGTVLFANNAFCTMVGKSYGEVVRKQYLNAVEGTNLTQLKPDNVFEHAVQGKKKRFLFKTHTGLEGKENLAITNVNIGFTLHTFYDIEGLGNSEKAELCEIVLDQCDKLNLFGFGCYEMGKLEHSSASYRAVIGKGSLQQSFSGCEIYRLEGRQKLGIDEFMHNTGYYLVKKNGKSFVVYNNAVTATNNAPVGNMMFVFDPELTRDEELLQAKTFTGEHRAVIQTFLHNISEVYSRSRPEYQKQLVKDVEDLGKRKLKSI